MHEDESLAASTERALQQRGELAVAVGHVRRPLLQRRHHVAQGAEALVDVLRLLEPVAGGFRTRHPFAARQVHEVEHPARASARVFRDPLHVDDDGAVAAGRSLVHRGGARRAVHLALEHHLGDVPSRAHGAGHRARNVKAGLLRGQNLNLVTADRGEQIPALLVVNLQHGHGHLVRVRGAALLYEVEEIVQGAIVDSARGVSRLGSGWSRHRVRLPRARLTVRHEANVVPVARASDQRAALLVNSTLRRVRAEDAVKAERLALGDAALVQRPNRDALRRGVFEVARRCVAGNLHDVPLAAVRARKVRPDPAEDAYGTLEVLDGVVKVSVLGESLVVQRGSRRELLHRLHQRELLPRKLLPFELERGVRGAQFGPQVRRVPLKLRVRLFRSSAFALERRFEVGNLSLVRGDGGGFRVVLGILHRALVPGDDGRELGSRRVALRRLLRELRLRGARFFPGGAELERGFPRGVFRFDKRFG